MVTFQMYSFSNKVSITLQYNYQKTCHVLCDTLHFGKSPLGKWQFESLSMLPYRMYFGIFVYFEILTTFLLGGKNDVENSNNLQTKDCIFRERR